MASKRLKFWEQSLTRQKDRLGENDSWFPFPALLAFALTLTIVGKVSTGVNPRFGNPSEPLVFVGEPERDTPIWFSVTPLDDEIVVTTNDRKVFRWSQKVTTDKPLEAFVTYLKERGAEETLTASLVKKVQTNQTKVVMSADQRLKYLHIKPIIYALAAAGITNYAFETNLILAEADVDKNVSHDGHAAPKGHDEPETHNAPKAHNEHDAPKKHDEHDAHDKPQAHDEHNTHKAD